MTQSEQELAVASAGLLYPSETDAPINVFTWPTPPGGDLGAAVAAHAPRGSKIEEISLEAFFGELADADEAEKFTQLHQAVQRVLTGTRVFRIGRRRIEVYVLGRTAQNELTGLHTVSVET